MKLYTKECLADLSEKVDLVETLREFLGDEVIEHAGYGNFEITCPFCNDKNRSMIANDRFNKFHCFECEASGDAVTFLMSHQKMTFDQTIKYLAEKFNVKLEEATKENSKVTDEDTNDLLDSLIEKLQNEKKKLKMKNR